MQGTSHETNIRVGRRLHACKPKVMRARAPIVGKFLAVLRERGEDTKDTFRTPGLVSRYNALSTASHPFYII